MQLLLAQHLLRALLYLHEEAGYAHLDTKPGNILLCRDGSDGSVVAKLGDFGGAEPMDDMGLLPHMTEWA